MMKYDPNESALKLALDAAELIELVPTTAQEDAVNHNDSGGLVLVPPRHPAVIAFIQELDGMEYESSGRPENRTPSLARRQSRLSNPYCVSGHVKTSAGQCSTALCRCPPSSYARAAAKHWHKVVNCA